MAPTLPGSIPRHPANQTFFAKIELSDKTILPLAAKAPSQHTSRSSATSKTPSV